MLVNRLALTCAAVVIFSGVPTRASSDVCSIALQSNAFNTSDRRLSSLIALEQREEICRRSYSSVEEFRAAARSGGFSLSYAGVGLGASGGRSDAQGRLSFSEERFCSENEVAFTQQYDLSEVVTVADVALQAWTRCVEVTRRNSLWLSYTVSADGTGMFGTITRTIDGSASNLARAILRITDLQVQPDDHVGTVRCHIAGQSFTQESIRAAGGFETTSAREEISCTKPDNVDVRIALQSDAGGLSWIELPSRETVEITDVNVLAQRLEGTLMRLADAEAAIGRLNVRAPTNLVAFFLLEDCPIGWVSYDEAVDRVIVGAAPGSQVGLRTETPARATIARENLPNMTLRLPTRWGGGNHPVNDHWFPSPHPWAVQATPQGNYVEHRRETERLGDGVPMDLPLPPHVTLRACRAVE